MASSNSNADGAAPQLLLTAPALGQRQPSSLSATDLHRRRKSRGAHQEDRHIRLPVFSRPPKSPASSIYVGSFNQSRRRSRSSHGTPGTSAPASPRASMSHSHLESLLQDLSLDLDTYGVEELRDGFFDASFVKPPKADHAQLMKDAEYTLPIAFSKRINPLSLEKFFPQQWKDIKRVVLNVTTTRAGIKLTKTFLGVFIAYVLCLIPAVRIWLGKYSYIMVLSSVVNHPGRTIGAQIDGAFLTIVGSATGLGWGAFGLWLAESTAVAQSGYGGILATFLILFMGSIAALRSYFIRLYQLVLCAGIAVIYTVLADTSPSVAWRKLSSFGVPWLFGQALCLLICCLVFPDAGSRPLAVALHDAFGVMQDGLIVPQPNPLGSHRSLAYTFVNLSQAHRDLVLDISITRFQPQDIESLRNLMQAVIRSLLSLKTESHLFEEVERNTVGAGSIRRACQAEPDGQRQSQQSSSGNTPAGSPDWNEVIIDIDGQTSGPPLSRTNTGNRAVKLVTSKLAEPTAKLLDCMRASMARCDAVLMSMSGYRKYLGPAADVSENILGSLTKIRKSMIKYDTEEESLMINPDLPPTYSDHPEVVELFLFVHPIRQAATMVEALLVKVMEMQQRRRGWRIYLPSYPLAKALQRTNAQVRHDRGGVTAGYYFRSQSQLARTMKGMANVYKPLPRKHDHGVEEDPKPGLERAETLGKYEEEQDMATDRNAPKKARLRYKVWLVLHRLQGFETRFALKVAITTSLLAVPAWLSESRGWWNEYESWWSVVMVWVMSHPRVGGNAQDLVTRSFCGVLGALWGGLAYGADNGNPYVMAVFAALYMLPMLYRFTQSSHPRSGIVGCISFIVVSLGAKTADGEPSIVQIAWTRGVAIVVGVVAAVVVNWVLWPFVARHELRKALSAMLIYSSIIYRGVVATFLYYEKGEEPGKEDIERSEMLEGRLREGFVRIRQLLALTRHEIRLRGPFNPLPYSALIDGCERFFEYLVAVRQSSLFFRPHYMGDEQAAESLLAYRRDAVAAILMNLYILAGALRGDRKVPRYLPSAGLARKRLLDHMSFLESELASSKEVQKLESVRKWGQIYSYSYSQNLTGCVKQLETLQIYTKEIVGEQGFDPIDSNWYEK